MVSTNQFKKVNNLNKVLLYSENNKFGLQWLEKKKNTICRLIIYKSRDVRYARDSVDELRRKHRVFVGICYALCPYSHQHKVILKYFLYITRY